MQSSELGGNANESHGGWANDDRCQNCAHGEYLLGMKQWVYPCIGRDEYAEAATVLGSLSNLYLLVLIGVCLDIPSRYKRDGRGHGGVVQDDVDEWLMEFGRWVQLQVRTHATTRVRR
jgi:hypothetical protein